MDIAWIENSRMYVVVKKQQSVSDLDPGLPGNRGRGRNKTKNQKLRGSVELWPHCFEEFI